MLKGIDHVVILVANLESAMSSYREQGFTVVAGGRHPTGTHNALIGFADGSYLELLAFYEPRPQSRWWQKLARGGGLISACLQTNNLREEIVAMRNAHIDMGDPRPLSRVRPDGYGLKWVLSEYLGEHADLLPFLIEDETPREERVPKERRHPNGVTGIEVMTFAVEDLQVIRRCCAGAFQQAGVAIQRPDLNGSGLRFLIGQHRVEYVTPERRTGLLCDWLQARESSPYSLTLATESGESLQPMIESTQ